MRVRTRNRRYKLLTYLSVVLLAITAGIASPVIAAAAGREASSPESTAQVTLPDTVAGRRVAAYLKAFNSGDDGQMRAFISENTAASALERRSMDERIQSYRQIFDDLGSMRLQAVQNASESSITILVKSGQGEWATLTFEFEPQPPHGLMGIRIEHTEAPTEPSSAGPASEADAIAAAQARIESLVKSDQFSGVVLVAKDGKPILQQAAGLASKESGARNLLNTKFNLGSINKIFTQVAIGQLIEQGKVSLQDTIGKVLPDYPNRDAASRVTVLQLLNMTSGIGDFFGKKFEAAPKDHIRNLSDYLPFFAGDPLMFEPGSKQQYSNGGYVVLGLIIEKLSGQSYYDYVKQNIFKPAGMQDTNSYQSDEPTANMANGYTKEGAEGQGGRRNNIQTRPARGSSAGGGYSTAEDMLRFANALANGKLRIPSFPRTGEMRAGGPQTGPVGGSQPPVVTSGMRPANSPASRPGLGVAGGAPGINATLDTDIGGKYTIIVMSNYDPPAAMDVARYLREAFGRVSQ